MRKDVRVRVCVFVCVFKAKTQNVGRDCRRKTVLGHTLELGPEGGPLSLRSRSESVFFYLTRRQGSADKYIILCERVGVCPESVPGMIF